MLNNKIMVTMMFSLWVRILLYIDPLTSHFYITKNGIYRGIHFFPYFCQNAQIYFQGFGRIILATPDFYTLRKHAYVIYCNSSGLQKR